MAVDVADVSGADQHRPVGGHARACDGVCVSDDAPEPGLRCGGEHTRAGPRLGVGLALVEQDQAAEFEGLSEVPEFGEDVQDSAVHRDAQGDDADEAPALRFAEAGLLIDPLEGVGEAYRGPYLQLSRGSPGRELVRVQLRKAREVRRAASVRVGTRRVQSSADRFHPYGRTPVPTSACQVNTSLPPAGLAWRT